MDSKQNISGNVLGQIALMQSVIANLPSNTSILSFACQGLKDIPGVEQVYSNNKRVEFCNFPIEKDNRSYGTLSFQLEDKNRFHPYIPYVENFCFMLSIIFEERKQKEININLMADLENLVSDRTKELEQEISERKTAEERLSIALNGANSGIWDWNIKSGKVHFDKNYYTISGYEPYEFEGDYGEWKKRVHPEDLPRVEKKIQEYIEGNTDKYDVEFKFLKKDGNWMWINAKGKIFDYDEKGNPIRFTGIQTDIDSRKRTEEKLKKAQVYISNIINSMPSVIIGINEKGKISQMNKQAEIYLNKTLREVEGKNIENISGELAFYKTYVREAIETKREISKKRQRINGRGEPVYEDSVIFPLTANGVEGAVIRIDDITEKKRIDEMMIQSEKMLSVGGLAAGMAHEINNPLAGLIQTANVMASRLGNHMDNPGSIIAAQEAGTTLEAIKLFMEKRKILQMIDNINESGHLVADIVSNMLSFARKGDNKKSTHNLSEIIDKTITLAMTDYDLKKNYDFKNITIEKNIENDVPPILCESAKIQQVLLNILRNGAQAMIENETPQPLFQIDLYIESENDTGRLMACMDISDNGPGMDDMTRKRVFEPFFTTKPVGIGTGLGLSVSYFIIVEDHDGELSVQSQPGIGTTFCIKLPVY